MSKRDSNWYVPADWLWHLGLLVTLLCAGVFGSLLLPVVARLRTTHVATLYGAGVSLGVLGGVLLFVARLPLYRAHRFWTFGPGQLDLEHRRYYWLAYGAATASLLLFGVVWLRLS